MNYIKQILLDLKDILILGPEIIIGHRLEHFALYLALMWDIWDLYRTLGSVKLSLINSTFLLWTPKNFVPDIVVRW